jgi:hypothetical protein
MDQMYFHTLQAQVVLLVANSARTFSGMVPLWAEIIVISFFLALLAIIVIDS